MVILVISAFQNPSEKIKKPVNNLNQLSAYRVNYLLENYFKRVF